MNKRKKILTLKDFYPDILDIRYAVDNTHIHLYILLTLVLFFGIFHISYMNVNFFLRQVYFPPSILLLLLRVDDQQNLCYRVFLFFPLSIYST